MSQQDDALTGENEPTAELNESADDNQQDDELSLQDDTRASIYEKIAQKNAELRESAVRKGFLANPVIDDEELLPKGEAESEVAETEELEGTIEEQEAQPSRRVMTREEFLKEFGNLDLKMKVAGEEVVAPAGEFIKAHGLEKHLTKKMQEFYKKEKEVLDKYLADNPDGGEGVDQEVQEKYDELFLESPAKAAQYLQRVNAQKSSKQEERVKAHLDRAVADFRSLYPDCTDADWEQMNQPSWYNQHQDVLELRSKGDVFGTLLTAYARLRETKAQTEKPKTANETTAPPRSERKKAGQVIRTAIKPAQPVKKAAQIKPKAELDRDYIRSRAEAARKRMGLDT